jgi:hypothetical protein
MARVMEFTTGMVCHNMLSLRDRKLLRKHNLLEKEVDQRVVIAADEKSQTHPTPMKIFFVNSRCNKSYGYAMLKI